MFLAVFLSVQSLISYSGGSVQQGDWSGGPGTPGPVQNWNWAGVFLSETHMTWDKTPGSVYLDLTASRHVVSGAPTFKFACSGDINGDGNTDVVTCNSTTRQLVWSENDGTGTSWVSHTIKFKYGAYPTRGCSIVDINGDGFLDVVGCFANQAGDTLFWYENTDGTGLAWTEHCIDEYDCLMCIYSADIDNDGDNDVVASSTKKGVGLSWWENLDGMGTLMQKHTITDDDDYWQAWQLNLTDLDLDGDIDIIAPCHTSDYNYWLFFNDGSGLNWNIELIHVDDDEYGCPTSASTGDLDGDGDIDIAGTGSNPYYGQCYWLENVDGFCNVWEQHMLDDEFLGAYVVHVADLTGDGYPDIVAGAGYPIGTDEVVLWENAGGTGTNWLKHLLDSGYTCYDIKTADINNDSVMDVVTVNANGPVYWLSLHGEDNGVLTSSILDLVGYPEWQTINWEGMEPEGTDMSFLVRGSNNPDDMGVWSEAIQEPGDVSTYLDSTYRFIQYAVMMETSGLFGTPVLNQISFQYDNMGINGDEQSGIVLQPVAPNPSGRCPVLSFSTFGVRDAELTVFDLSGRQVFSISDRWSSGSHDVALPLLSSGTYMVYLVSEGFRQASRFMVLGQ